MALSSKVDKQLADLRAAASRYAEAGKARDQAIRKAAKAGLSVRKIGEAMELSHSRVHQIVHGR